MNGFWWNYVIWCILWDKSGAHQHKHRHTLSIGRGVGTPKTMWLLSLNYWRALNFHYPFHFCVAYFPFRTQHTHTHTLTSSISFESYHFLYDVPLHRLEHSLWLLFVIPVDSMSIVIIAWWGWWLLAWYYYIKSLDWFFVFIRIVSPWQSHHIQIVAIAQHQPVKSIFMSSSCVSCYELECQLDRRHDVRQTQDQCTHQEQQNKWQNMYDTQCDISQPALVSHQRNIQKF